MLVSLQVSKARLSTIEYLPVAFVFTKSSLSVRTAGSLHEMFGRSHSSYSAESRTGLSPRTFAHSILAPAPPQHLGEDTQVGRRPAWQLAVKASPAEQGDQKAILRLWCFQGLEPWIWFWQTEICHLNGREIDRLHNCCRSCLYEATK